MPRRSLFAPLLFLIAALAPLPALAHAILLDSDPAQGASVAPGAATLRLRFNSRIDAARSRVALLDPAGREHVLAIAPGAGPDVLTATTTLAPGAQALRWQVLAVDGHITRGEIRFTARPATP